RVAITALSSRPIIIDAARAALIGTRLEDEAIAAAAEAVHKTARPLANTSGTISQRKRASRVLTERALRALRPAYRVRAVAVVTAAGSAERFGGRKLLTPIDGEPLLDHTIRALLEGGAAEVIVVVGRDARADLERDVNAMLDPRVRPVENPDPSRGMFSSIQEGIAQAQGDAILA